MAPHLNQFNFKPKSYVNFTINKENYETNNYLLYKAIVTGNKKQLEKKTIKNFKQYGLLHLLTPSGLHLSSIVFVLKFSGILEFITLIFLFFYFFSHNQYFSLERVILFRIIFKLFHKKIEKYFDHKLLACFLITITLYCIIGRQSLSPLSLVYSFSFWCTIILFHERKIPLICYLNLTLYLLSSITGDLIKPLSLVLNPFFTVLITFIFPLLIFNFLLGGINFLDSIINQILSFYLALLDTVAQFDIIPSICFSTVTLLVFTFFILVNMKKTAFIWVCIFTCPSLNQAPLKSFQGKYIYNVPDNDPQSLCIQDDFYLKCKKSFSF